MKPPTRAVGSEASKRGMSFAQSTKLPRLNSQVEYDAATILSSNPVGRISFEGNEAKAIKARKAVPPAWPTVAYSKDKAPNSSANMVSAVGLLFRRRGQLENQQMKVGHIIRPTRLARLVPDADKVFRQVPKLGCRLPGSRRLGNLIYFARFYIVDKAVDRNMLGNERMIANPSNI